MQQILMYGGPADGMVVETGDLPGEMAVSVDPRGCGFVDVLGHCSLHGRRKGGLGAMATYLRTDELDDDARPIYVYALLVGLPRAR